MRDEGTFARANTGGERGGQSRGGGGERGGGTNREQDNSGHPRGVIPVFGLMDSPWLGMGGQSEWQFMSRHRE